MHRAMRRRRKIGEVPIDDHRQPVADISPVPTDLEIAAQKERDVKLAARVGMPPVGAAATSKAGIIWKVDGHTHASSLTTQGQEHSELSLYPVVIPQNLSPKLTEFLMEVSRCTPKAIVPLDTLPHQFPKRAHPGGHSVDSISDRYRILLFLDGSDASESVIAHELAHVWIELVRGIEDYRVMRDTSDSGRYSQVQLLQSFVLDIAVDTVLKEKGFDTSDIDVDKQAALRQMGQAASAGYQPPTTREAVYMASFLASSMLEEPGSNVLCSQTAALVQSRLPDVYRLANVFKYAVKNSPPTCAQSARKAIDQVLSAAFDYTDGGIDLAAELFEFKPEPFWDFDKHPDWLPGLSVKGKCEVGIAMARQGVDSDMGAQFERQENGLVRVRFQTPDGGHTPYTELEHVQTIPEGPEALMRRIMEINKINQRVMGTTGPGSSLPPATSDLDAHLQRVMELNEVNRRRLDEMSQGPSLPGLPSVGPPGPKLPPGFPQMPGRSYSPGLARFLTLVRLEELTGGEHPYGYANSNPISYIDPDGLQPEGRQKEWLHWLPYHEHLPPFIRHPIGTVSECINQELNPNGFFFWIGWGYGNCCGYERDCGPDSPVRNCTDAACRAHDVCVGPDKITGIINWLPCNMQFCNDIKFCWNNNCVKKPIDRRQCAAIKDIAAGFCGLFGGMPPSPGIPWT